MAFYLLFACGVLGGILGGMGMGGGTLLIPLLTLAGVPQNIAQGLNLLSFVPMSAVALTVHAKRGLVKGREALPVALPALLFSALFSLLSDFLPSAVLKLSFGTFLILLSLIRLKNALSAPAHAKIRM